MTPIDQQLAELSAEDRAKVEKAAEAMYHYDYPEQITKAGDRYVLCALISLRAVGAIAPEWEPWEVAWDKYARSYRPLGNPSEIFHAAYNAGFEARKGGRK